MRTRKRVTNNLVAMGSAAVVAVYAAGYVRTASAADKFAEMSNERRPVIAPGSEHANSGEPPVAMVSRAERGTKQTAADGASAEGSTTAASAVAGSADRIAATATGEPSAARTANEPIVTAQQASALTNKASGASVPNASTLTVNASSNGVPNKPPVIAGIAVTTPTGAASANAPAVSGMAVSSVATATPAPSVAASLSSPVTTSAAAPAASSAAVLPVAVPPAATLPVPVSVSPATTAPVAAPDAPARTAAVTPPAKPQLAPGVKYRDGEYYGWGTSRHGDIQAYVEVTDGKVSYVKIAQCLTQYSCGLIDMLPGQVFSRNGPEVDSVSGATQSSNAFYYAVQQALSKAK